MLLRLPLRSLLRHRSSGVDERFRGRDDVLRPLTRAEKARIDRRDAPLWENPDRPPQELRDVAADVVRQHRLQVVEDSAQRRWGRMR